MADRWKETLEVLVGIANEAAMLRAADRAAEAAGVWKTGVPAHDAAVDSAASARATSRKRIDRALVAWQCVRGGGERLTSQ